MKSMKSMKSMNKFRAFSARRSIRVLLGIALALGLAGCQSGAAVTVDIDVPRPLIEPIDVTMGIYFDETLKTFVHEESLEDYGTYSIDIGASQVPVFEQVFDAMFTSTVPMTALSVDNSADDQEQSATPQKIFASADGRAVSLQGILAPTIKEVQFAIPEQTGGEFYEVWINYHIQLFDTDGTLLVNWPLIGYGKANQRNYRAMDQKESGLNSATIWALRDAAALLSFQFRDQAEVQDWLAAAAGTTP